MSGDILFQEYSNLFSQEDKSANTKSAEENIEKKSFFGYSPFALQDAVGGADKKKIWIEYQRLVEDGISPEDLFFKINDKVRDMLAIKLGVGRAELEIKSDFVYKKSLAHGKRWEEQKLKLFYKRLVGAYYRSRMSDAQNVFVGFREKSMGSALEKIILSL